MVDWLREVSVFQQWQGIFPFFFLEWGGVDRKVIFSGSTYRAIPSITSCMARYFPSVATPFLSVGLIALFFPSLSMRFQSTKGVSVLVSTIRGCSAYPHITWTPRSCLIGRQYNLFLSKKTFLGHILPIAWTLVIPLASV